MKRNLYLFILAFLFAGAASAQKLQSPAEFLGYKLGDQFTRHHRIVDYFNYVAQNSKNVKLQQYGTTNEGRPLLVMFIGSDQNINRLEAIRQHNLSLTGQGAATDLPDAPVIVWLSFNVHGNEPSSSEAAMQTLYDMVDPGNTRTQAWLKNTLVVIDPCLNPDGRDRYVNFYNSVHGAQPNPYNYAREHMEPWPGGRVNHYYFDLNRDWAWQTQKETKARVGLWDSWVPEIHVDFHEQGYNSPYYFAPAAEPFHRDITPWQREFQTTIGKNNAKYFDQHGWMYFTREEFDLLYPSYGDTYPIYNGSIGMTYEQGGISAGLSVITRSGDTLTLADRIAHHHSNALSTVETSSANAQKVLQEFKKYYDNSRSNPPGEYKTYLIKNTNNDKMAALADLLKRNGIQYGFGAKGSGSGYDYLTGKTAGYTINDNDMVVNAYQPKSVLLNVLLEPKTFVADSNTYDITAWSLPYVYGLPAYGIKEAIKPGNDKLSDVVPPAGTPQHAYAYLAPWTSVQDVRFMAALLKKNIKVRYTSNGFENGGKKYPPGSLIITRAGNDVANFDEIITQTATEFNRTLIPVASGFVDKGADFGSSTYIRYVHPPRVMLVSGDDVSSEAMGEVWYYFEQQIGYPVTLIRYQDLNRIRLSDFDVAIFPDGDYDNLPLDKLQSWVREGGRLIAMQGMAAQLADQKGFSLKKKEDKKDDKSKTAAAQRTYGEREHEALRSSVPGAIYKLTIDNTHPLGFGMPNYYFDLKLDDNIYDYLGDDGWNVGTIKKDAYMAGFVGEKAKAKIADGLLLGVQQMGRGNVVYMIDDPLFRSFWEGGKLLFGNAVFMVGQ